MRRLSIWDCRFESCQSAIERVNHVGLHDDSRPPAPAIVLAADGDHAIERNYNLDGVVRVSRHDALGARNEQESALP